MGEERRGQISGGQGTYSRQHEGNVIVSALLWAIWERKRRHVELIVCPLTDQYLYDVHYEMGVNEMDI